MLQKKNGDLYLLDDTDPYRKIILSYFRAYENDLDICLYNTQDTVVTIDKGQSDIYNCFEKFFNSVMKEYNNESNYKKNMYRESNFVDTYNNIISFYSDLCIWDWNNSNLFQICKTEDKFELRLFYNSKAEHPSKSLIVMYDGYYRKYTDYLCNLHLELEKLAVSMEKPTEEKLVVETTEEPLVKTKKQGLKERIKGLFQNRQ